MNNIVKNNLTLVNDKITKACKLYQQNPKRVNLIAVCKKVDETKIIQAINLGQKDFGENYIQEAKEKWPKIKDNFPDVKLHFIGQLQSNKASLAVDLFDSIHSLDSKKLALELKKAMDKKQKNLEIFIQINIGKEEQKGGILPEELGDFMNFIKNDCPLNIVGLMCIPPENEEPSPYFALLNKLAKENNLNELSMGMSADYESAIAMQASYIRVGSAIFGKREK